MLWQSILPTTRNMAGTGRRRRARSATNGLPCRPTRAASPLAALPPRHAPATRLPATCSPADPSRESKTRSRSAS